jgi:hypothetical protein
MRSVAGDKAKDFFLSLLSPIMAFGYLVAYLVMAATVKAVPSEGPKCLTPPRPRQA